MSRKRAAPKTEENWLFDLPMEPEPPAAADDSPAEAVATQTVPAEEPPIGGLAEGEATAEPPATPIPAGAEPHDADGGEPSADGEPMELFTEPPAAPEWEAEREPAGWDESLDLEAPSEDEPLGAAAEAAPRSGPPGPIDRLRAGLVDLGVILGVVLAALAGATLMGVDVLAGTPAALALFALVFSFLYFTLPLAFWGRTPGMATIGLVARNEGGRPLTFAQTFLRWLGAIATFLAAGLPLLLALTGASLSDRISGSHTTYRG